MTLAAAYTKAGEASRGRQLVRRQPGTAEVNTNVPQTARIWNYWLGGKDNFPVDRQVGDQVLEAFPAIVENARASRAFLARAVEYLADNDPIVLAHARALLTSRPEGATAYIDADLRDPDTILREAARTLDLTQPIAIMLMGILGHIADDEQAQSIVKRLLRGVPAGSYLTMNDGTDTSEEWWRPRASGTSPPTDLPPAQPRSDRSLLRQP